MSVPSNTVSKYQAYKDQEHEFAQYIRILGKGKKGTRSLTYSESKKAFGLILNNKVLDEQLGAFMMLLRVKEESVPELVGFVSAVKENIQNNLSADKSLNNLKIDLDWPSYAGKKKHHAWYLLACMTLAKHGIKILMHGASGHTINRVYSDELLQGMGVTVASSYADITKAVDNENLCYVPLELLQPKLAEIINMRNVFGLRSPVHTLARLINPFDAPFSIQSIFHPAYQPNHLWSALRLGYKNTLVIKGDGGEFERNPDARTKVLGIRDASPYTMRLPMLNPKKSAIETDLSLEKLQAVWHGDDKPTYALQAITETLALALLVTKKAHSYKHAQSLAHQMWENRFNIS